jgi:hypothetical protein
MYRVAMVARISQTHSKALGIAGLPERLTILFLNTVSGITHAWFTNGTKYFLERVPAYVSDLPDFLNVGLNHSWGPALASVKIPKAVLNQVTVRALFNSLGALLALQGNAHDESKGKGDNEGDNCNERDEGGTAEPSRPRRASAKSSSSTRRRPRVCRNGSWRFSRYQMGHQS